MTDDIENFHSLLKSHKNPGLYKGESYAMWHACDDDPCFSSSKIVDLWKKIYIITKGIESFIAAYCQSMKTKHEESEWEKDDYCTGASWWESTLKVSALIEKNGPVEELGRVF